MPPIILYDGVCGLCNRFICFVIRHDRRATFKFAPIQSNRAAGILASHSLSNTTVDTVYVVVDSTDKNFGPAQEGALLTRSDAVLFILNQLGGLWRAFALLLAVFPRSLRDAGYGILARHRYRIFGRYSSCPLPGPELKGRFLDV